MVAWTPVSVPEIDLMNKHARTWREGALILVAAALPGVSIILFKSLDIPNALFSPWLPPGNGHLLGTNDVGQDIFFQLIFAGGRSLMVGLAAALTATLVGTLTGCVAGYYRGIADRVIMGLADIFLLIPDIPLVIVLVSFFEPGLFNVIIVIAMTSWPGTARVVRSRVLKIKESAFVLNARSLGAGDGHIILRHILPHTGELILAKATLAVASAMLTETGISFLGLGDPCQVTWGSMLHGVFAGAGLINGYWWWYLPPVLCISVTVMGFNLAGFYLQKGWGGNVLDDLSLNKQGRTQEERQADDLVVTGIAPPVLMKKINKGTKILAPEPDTRNPISKAHNPAPHSRPPFFCLKRPVFQILNLGVEFETNQKKNIKALDGVNLTLENGDRMAIIGESGSGKSVLFLAMLGLLPGNARISGEIFFKGKGMTSFSQKQYQHIRAWDVAYVPQGAGNALNPVIKVGHQVSERMRIHGGICKKEGMVMAATLLGQTGIINSHQRVHYYPHQFSGGMNQRVLLAMALAGENSVLLADEPTKGLDDKTKEDVLNIFLKFDREAIAVVTHDLWFARKFAGTIVVMYKGIILEQAPADSFFKAPYHPYSKALLNALPFRGILNPVIMSSHNGYGEADFGDNDGGNGDRGDQKDKKFSGGCPWVRECEHFHERCWHMPRLYSHNTHKIRCWCHAPKN